MTSACPDTGISRVWRKFIKVCCCRSENGEGDKEKSLNVFLERLDGFGVDFYRVE